MKNVMHHARLKDIFEELIVVNGPPCFDLKNPSLTDGMSVSIEALQYLAFTPQKHWNNYLVFLRIPLLYAKYRSAVDRFFVPVCARHVLCAPAWARHASPLQSVVFSWRPGMPARRYTGGDGVRVGSGEGRSEPSQAQCFLR